MLSGGEHFRISNLIPQEEHDALQRKTWIAAWLERLAIATEQGNEEGAAAARAELDALGYTREEAHTETKETTRRKAPETR